MENTNSNWDEMVKEHQVRHRRGRILWGAALFLVGGVFLLEQLGVSLPDWLTSWQMLLIVMGTLMLIMHNLRSFGGFVLILVGTAFLFPSFLHGLNLDWNTVGAIILMLIGLRMIFFSRKRRFKHFMKDKYRREFTRRNYQRGNENFCVFGSDKTASAENTVNIEVVFGGIKKHIISKDFKGGNIDCTFGGGELNFSQADINGTAVLNIDLNFSGLKLIVPANWNVRTEGVRTVCADVSDKRVTVQPDENKTLVINGEVNFGGIDIRNY